MSCLPTSRAALRRTFALVATIPLVLVSSCGTNRALTPADELALFVSAVSTLHPAPYRYTVASEWSRAVGVESAALERDLPSWEPTADRERDELRFASALHRVASLLGDFHVQVSLPLYGDPDADIRIFPLPLFPVAEGIAVDASVQGISAGTIVTAVNGVPMETVLAETRGLVSADGRTDEAIDAELIEDFSRFHALRFGFGNVYNVTLELPDGVVENRTLAPASRTEYAEARAARRSVEIRMHGARGTAMRRDGDAAIISLHTFVVEDIDARVAALRAELEANSDAQHLIIDIRGNRGGYRTLAFPLLDALIDEPYPQRIRTETIVASIPRSLRRNVSELFPGALARQARRSDGHGPPYSARGDEAEALMSPVGSFRGDVTVITDGLVNSAANELLITLRAFRPDVRVVGRPVGGACDEHIGDIPVLLTLPTSNVRVLMSLARITHTNVPECEPGTGLEPDVHVLWSRTDLITSRDPDMEAALQGSDPRATAASP